MGGEEKGGKGDSAVWGGGLVWFIYGGNNT